MNKPFLSRKISWVFLIVLVYIDAILDIVRGKEGNPLWIPFVEKFGMNIVLFLAVFVLILFYFAVKILSKIVIKIDKTRFAEEILLTTFVVVYALFDIWTISVDFFEFGLIKNFRYTIPFLIIAGLIYALWAQKKVGKKKRERRNNNPYVK